MKQRESTIVLFVCVVLSLVIHIALAPLVVHGLSPHQLADSDSSTLPETPAPLVDRDDVIIGDDTGLLSTVAWISHDDYRELFADKSRTEQPALQTQVDPVEQGPAEIIEPTEPTTQVADAVEAGGSIANPTRQSPAESATTPADTPADQTQAAQAEAGPGPRAPGDGRDDVNTNQPAPQRQPQPNDASGSSAIQRAESPNDATGRDAAVAQGGKPTAAAKSDRESPPTNLLLDKDYVVPGRVITAQGVKIKTVVPRFSVVTSISTLPRNPAVDVVFDKDGAVTHVILKQSGGAENIDGPVVASVYKWTASGERLKELDGPFVIRDMRILLTRY